MCQHEGALLGDLIFHASDLAVDHQLMGVGIIVHHAHTTHLQHIVDILDIAGHLLIGLSQLVQVLLPLLIRVGHLGDLTSTTEDTHQFAVLVPHRHYLQFIAYHFLPVAEEILGRTVIVSIVSDELGQMDVFQMLHVQIWHTQHVADGNTFLEDSLHIGVKRATAFLVEVAHIAILIVVGHIQQYRIEDGPIAYHIIACRELHPFLLCHVTARADDDRRLSVLMIAQHRQRHGILSYLAVLVFPRQQVYGVILYFTLHDAVDGLHHVVKAILDVHLCQILQGERIPGKAVLVQPG